jgi:carbon monoxide dehydrogenase subunit G
MKLEGKYMFNAPPQKVWDVLLDMNTLKACMPGCESLEEIGPDEFEATLKIGVAAVKGTYSGKVQIRDKNPPNSYAMAIEGSGTPGFVKGEGALTLSDKGGKTEVHYTGEAQVGGLVASIGQRMIGGVAKLMVSQFFKALEKQF